MRIGHGYDVHALIPGTSITLCGVEIPFDKSLKAHSDGDVAIHAICDALLGAAALGDIGNHFPDSDDRYKNIDSVILLGRVVKKLSDNKLLIQNVDVTIVAQAPKLAPHIQKMRKKISMTLNKHIDCINIKATTTEGLGFCGRGEGIEAHCVAIIGEDG